MKRVACAKDLELRQLFNGPESFTPDGKALIGEVPEVCNTKLAINHGSCYL